MVRQALAGFGEAVQLPALELNDIRTALTEACNNASIHAYGGDEGPMEVELHASPDEIDVAVRDRGRGLGDAGGSPQMPDPMGDELPGIGLPAIHALADRVHLGERPGGGTEVAMTFATPDIRLAPDGAGLAGVQPAALPGERLSSTVALDIVPLALAQWVFPRVLRAMAARAYFTIDRLADAQRVGSVLVADAASICSEPIHAGITATSDGVDFAIGPIAHDTAHALACAVRDVEPCAETLAAGHFLSVPDASVGLRIPRTR
jgi:serine/threonine-protein kinase RsbW